MSTDLRRSIDLMLKSAESVGYQPVGTGRREFTTNENDVTALYTNGELARQLRTCMREIVELRSELAAERDARSQLVALHVKRAKEELHVEFRGAQHTIAQDFRELEAQLKQRLSDSEVQRGTDRRKIDEALRLAKAHERTQYDTTEQLRESLDELRGRVEAATALCVGTRSEATQELERERVTLQHRLDVELMRYAELHRAQQHDLEDARRCMVREIDKVNHTVSSLVDAAWAEKARTLTKHVQDSLDEGHTARDRMSKTMTELQRDLDSAAKAFTRDIAVLNASMGDRLGALEAALPALTSRAERFERRADGAVEACTKLMGSIDVLREAVDKASAHATRAVERAQKVEDTMADRDGRIASIESQCVALSGVESFRLEIEALKRSVSRVDNAADAAVKASSRAERVAEDVQRSADAAGERADASEKRVAKMASRIEVADQRVASFSERLVALEDGSERLAGSLAALEQHRDAQSSKVASLDSRLTALTERSDTGSRELRDRLAQCESRADVASDTASRAVDLSTQSTKECDRLAKRVAKSETSVFNAAENAQALRTSLEHITRALETHGSRLEALDRLTATAHSTAVQAVESTRESSRQLTTFQDRLSTLNSQLSSVARDTSLALARSSGPSEVAVTSDISQAAMEHALRDSVARVERKLTQTFDNALRDVTDRLEAFEDNARAHRPPSAAGVTVRDVQRIETTVQEHATLMHDLRSDLTVTERKLVALETSFARHITSERRSSTVLPQEPAPLAAIAQPTGTQLADLSPTMGTFTLGSDADGLKPFEVQSAESAGSTPPRSISRVPTDVAAALHNEKRTSTDGAALPPLAPGTRPAQAAMSARVTANPYETEGSESRSASVMSAPVQRRRALESTDDSSPTGDSDESPDGKPSPGTRRPFLDSDAESMQVTPFARAQPTTNNVFQESPDASESPSAEDERRRIALSLATQDNPFVTPQAAARVAEHDYDDFDEDENDEAELPPVRTGQAVTPIVSVPHDDTVVSAPSARGQTAAAGVSPMSSKATNDVSLSLTTTTTLPGHGSGSGKQPAEQKHPQPPQKPAAWDFDDDDGDDGDAAPMGDDELAGLM